MMNLFCSGCLVAVLATGGVLAAPLHAAAQSVGATTGQNPGSFSLSGSAPVPAKSPSVYSNPAVALGSDGLPLKPSISTVPSLPGQPGATLKVGHIPNEGETDQSGNVVHYKMVGREPGTGYGLLTGIRLPPRSFNNVESHDQ
jgi:hypothetical protein